MSSPDAPTSGDLEARLDAIQKRLDESARPPMWRRFEISGPIAAATITAINSLTTMWVESKSRQAALQQTYLDKAIEVQSNPVGREVLPGSLPRALKPPLPGKTTPRIRFQSFEFRRDPGGQSQHAPTPSAVKLRDPTRGRDVAQ